MSIYVQVKNRCWPQWRQGALEEDGAALQQQHCRPEERECTQMRGRLEAFAVHNGWAGLVVLLLGDPHLLEGGQRGQDGAADPH